MDFALKMMDSVLNIMDFVLKMMDFVLKRTGWHTWRPCRMAVGIEQWSSDEIRQVAGQGAHSTIGRGEAVSPDGSSSLNTEWLTDLPQDHIVLAAGEIGVDRNASFVRRKSAFVNRLSSRFWEIPSCFLQPRSWVARHSARSLKLLRQQVIHCPWLSSQPWQGRRYVFFCCMLCIHMPTIDRSLVYTCRRLIDLLYIHAGDW